MSTLTAAAAGLATCRGVAVRYRVGGQDVVALEGVDLAIEPGEALALQGRSGSGKTTLLHLLGGLLIPTEGSVEWKGIPLSSLDAEARAKARAGGIAYVFQGANLLPTFTAFENVSFAAWARTRSRSLPPEPGEGRGSAELLELVGLGRKLDSLPAELSGGEAQRVAIARALAQAPELLLCDEPTGHLDSDTGERVLDLVDALQERFGFALIVATHDADVARRYPRQMQLIDGRVVEEGPSA
jgi:ABC-type lipoprotein export system ATPase subunit